MMMLSNCSHTGTHSDFQRNDAQNHGSVSDFHDRLHGKQTEHTSETITSSVVFINTISGAAHTAFPKCMLRGGNGPSPFLSPSSRPKLRGTVRNQSKSMAGDAVCSVMCEPLTIVRNNEVSGLHVE